MLSNIYSKQTVEEARRVVAYVERRSRLLTELAMELKQDLEKFKYVEFVVDKTKRTVSLTYKKGMKKNTVYARCDIADYFSELIGKYICVKRALGQPYKKVYSAIENRPLCVKDFGIEYFNVNGFTGGGFSTNLNTGFAQF